VTSRGTEWSGRRSIRLKGYDYASQGAYFVTIVTQGRERLFGEIVNGAMHVNEAGRIIERCWLDVPRHFPHAALDAYVVMPNHVHGIIVITDTAGAKNDDVGAKNLSPLPIRSAMRSPSRSVGSIVRGFKIGVTKWFRGNTNVYTVWQRNYYEHIIRDDAALDRIREYIRDNPIRWASDRENLATAATE